MNRKKLRKGKDLIKKLYSIIVKHLTKLLDIFDKYRFNRSENIKMVKSHIINMS